MSAKILFNSLGLNPVILSALSELNYTTPTPVQKASIPILLKNDNLLAQAQTGTGKTAAFALPILTKLDLSQRHPQALILAPTRELAIQVAEAFKSFAKHMNGFQVLTVYGGQDYNIQLKALKRGVHIIVGTPGRIMDHLRRGTLVINKIKTVIIDEADEMLKMGFIDDVKWILQQIEGEHQIALFSATIPNSIRKIANQYLGNAKEVRIDPDVKTVAATKQYYMLTTNNHKLEALTRFLEMESFDAILIFTRTKTASTDLAEKLKFRGYNAAAMNGDMNQKQREKVIFQVKRKSIDIIVATDVAARGLDIDRISHVISYDIPFDAESYIHRIGRTGRAGREGKALLMVTPKERYMLRIIEKTINQNIEAINPPSTVEINKKRNETFIADIQKEITGNDFNRYRSLIETIIHETDYSELDVAAALTGMLLKEKKSIKFGDDSTLQKALKEEENSSNDRFGGKRRHRDRSRNQNGNRGDSRSSHRKGGKTKESFHKKFDKDKPFHNAKPKKKRT